VRTRGTGLEAAAWARALAIVVVMVMPTGLERRVSRRKQSEDGNLRRELAHIPVFQGGLVRLQAVKPLAWEISRPTSGALLFAPLVLWVPVWVDRAEEGLLSLVSRFR